VVLRDIFEDDSRQVRTVHVYTARYSPDGVDRLHVERNQALRVYVMRAKDGRNRQRISDDGDVFPSGEPTAGALLLGRLGFQWTLNRVAWSQLLGFH
jgi:hypothetical protein